MKVFVAGATGAIGRPLTRALLEHGHDVSGLTRSQERAAGLSALGARPVVCDVLDSNRLADELTRLKPEAIVNELTDLPPSLSPKKLTAIYAANDRVRRDGTANLLRAAHRCGASRMVVQSAAYWYAPEGARVKTEEDPLFVDAPEPIGTAVRTMREVEECVLADGRVEAVVLRYGQFYGPGTWYAPDGDIGRRFSRNLYPMIGDGSASLSFIHVDDAARATVAALGAPPGVYNIVDEEPAAATDWMPVLAEAVGARPPRRVPVALARLLAGKALVSWSVATRGADNSRAKAAMGWEPRYGSWRTGFLKGDSGGAPRPDTAGMLPCDGGPHLRPPG